ncbi:MAG: hypothetical protein PHE89_05210 [Alphaproteobacteria bacterium]|nr:hypothetical protein [Alphaproteobacteria bacterium]
MKKNLVALMVMSLLVGTSTKVFAQDEVTIDLSVLEGLGGNSSEAVQPVAQVNFQTVEVAAPVVAEPSQKSVSTLLNLPPLQPKFPVVKPQPKKKIVAKKVKPAPKKVVKEEKNPFTKSQIVECQTYFAEKEKAQLSNVDRIIQEYEENKALEQELATMKAEDVAVVETPVEPVAEPAPEVVVPVEDVIPASESVAEVAPVESVVTEPVAEAVPEVITPVAETTPVEPVVEAVMPAEVPVPVAESVEKVVAAPVAELVVEAPADDFFTNSIQFAEGVTTLTEVDKVKINSIMSRFENPYGNKIGIIAYNLDNGQDSFKRKRECLNRATEIRSYLLSQGYKEFKIKVVNVDDSSDRINMIEIDELL